MCNPHDEVSEIETIIRFAKKLSTPTETYPVYHIDSFQRVKRYVKKAEEITKYVRRGKILDWGSGYGQMLFLLHNRGLDVTGCELSEHYKHGTLADLIGLKIIYLSDPVNLPFEDLSFDALLSCGVLEHVKNSDGSLKEINRVLKRGGYFFIYNLPNKFAYMEFISRRILRKGHENLYSLNKTRRWLKGNGFKIVKSYYECFLPVNMGFAVNKLRRLADNYLYDRLNDFFPRMPLLKYFSQNLTIICQKV